MAAAEHAKHAEHAEHPTDAVQSPEEHTQSQPQPEASNKTPKRRRKTSFSDASSRFAFETFSRRRMSTNLPHSTSLASVHTQSRLPTPAGIPRTTSYFSNLSSLNSNTTVQATSTRLQSEPPEKSATNNNDGKDNKADFPKSTSTSGIPIAPASTQKKVGPNLAPSHPRLSTPHHHLTGPVTPTSTDTQKSKNASGNTDTGSNKSKTKRESSVHIAQHKLMQPLPPPLPKANSTMSSLMTGTSANIVGGARTSVGKKRDSGGMVGGSGSGNANVDANVNPSVNPNVNPNPHVSKGSSSTADQTQTETKTETKTETDTASPLAPKANLKSETQAKTETASPLATKANAKTETQTKTEIVSLLATKANAKTKSPAQTQPQTQSPPDVNKPLPDFHTNPLYIKEAQPQAYWCGRLSALNDRFRMEDMMNPSPSSSNTVPLGAATRRLTDDERRTRRIFVHLQGLCVTDEARASLDAFQTAYEKVGAGAGAGAQKGKGGAGAKGVEAKGAGGFLEKLMGKK